MAVSYSNIKTSDTEWIRPGDSVSQGDGNWSDEDWAELYASNIVGDADLPFADMQFDETPQRYKVRKALEAVEEAINQAVSETPSETMAAEVQTPKSASTASAKK
jgi:hypothetical protein